MKISISKSLQRGFTLIEVLIGVALVGVLAGVITAAIYQIITVNASSTARMTAIKQVENAINYLRKDLLMAQTIIPDATDPSGFPLVIRWTEWNTNNKYTINYYLNSDTHELYRQKSINGGTPETTLIAKNIESISVISPETYSGGKIAITITSMVGGMRPASETRTFEVLPRPAT
ncbi:MAG: prepilin-type N-terminal cleavage/methylation domain-containing protein [Dehalococcoidales bacterium]|jgi:prepilin-type N-terminal cleavage/methylation domain-containing protein|nr:prepilin-type N-terminal cleavage/methylation domain-containing protein [Dehalococcoidales bacterium]